MGDRVKSPCKHKRLKRIVVRDKWHYKIVDYECVDCGRDWGWSIIRQLRRGGICKR